MKHYLIRNKTDGNVSALIKVNPGDELGNLGHEAAVTIKNDTLSICLAPSTVVPSAAVASASEVFDLADDGIYAIEIGGILQPYTFTPEALAQAFNGTHPSMIKFNKTLNISCVGATNSVLFTEAVLPDGTNPPAGTGYIKIDGVEFPENADFPEWLELQFLIPQQVDQSEIPIGFKADGDDGNLRKWINNDTISHRIEMGSRDPSVLRTIIYGNSTVIQFTDVKGEHTGVCLAPAV